jgi:hypothetical protein
VCSRKPSWTRSAPPTPGWLCQAVVGFGERDVRDATAPRFASSFRGRRKAEPGIHIPGGLHPAASGRRSQEYASYSLPDPPLTPPCQHNFPDGPAPPRGGAALDHQARDAYSRDRFFRGRITEDPFMSPKVLSAASAAILLSLVSLDSASAAGGCGPGFHPGPYGRCRPNERPVIVVPGAPVVVAPAPVVVAPAPVVCTGGFRWHPRLRRCVVL